MVDSLITRLCLLREKIVTATAGAGRPVEHVTLIAVSKTQSVAAIREAYDAGLRHFGENYVQELVVKTAQLPSDIIWHGVGHVQRNKVKVLLPHIAWLHSLDSERLATEIEQRATTPLRCLIEVNIAGEATKQGVAPDVVIPLLSRLAQYSHLQIRGLMGMPPPVAKPEQNRPHFRALAQLLSAANTAQCYPTPLTELSMGMSDDFAVAIEEGATMVRIGRALFGERR